MARNPPLMSRSAWNFLTPLPLKNLLVALPAPVPESSYLPNTNRLKSGESPTSPQRKRKSPSREVLASNAKIKLLNPGVVEDGEDDGDDRSCELIFEKPSSSFSSSSSSLSSSFSSKQIIHSDFSASTSVRSPVSRSQKQQQQQQQPREERGKSGENKKQVTVSAPKKMKVVAKAIESDARQTSILGLSTLTPPSAQQQPPPPQQPFSVVPTSHHARTVTPTNEGSAGVLLAAAASVPPPLTLPPSEEYYFAQYVRAMNSPPVLLHPRQRREGKFETDDDW
jgi:hypothetical protein